MEKMMKLNVQFDAETRFDHPVRCETRNGTRRPPGNRVPIRAMHTALRPEPIMAEWTGAIFPEDANP